MKTKTKAFTLVETLVAIAILTLAVAGAFSAAQSGIASSTYSKNQVVAFYLAQEAVEQIRNMRDNNGLQKEYWLTGISANVSDPCWFGTFCYANPTATWPGPFLIRCLTNSQSCPLLKQTSTGIYTTTGSSNPDTIFRRGIQLTLINPHEVSISVTVTWSQGITTRTFTIRENIFDWQTT